VDVLNKRFFFALPLAAALVLGACGGDDDDDNGSNDDATQPAGATQPSDATQTSSQPTTSASPTTTSGNGNNDIPDALQDALEGIEDRDYTATYELKTDSGDGEMTIAQKDGKYASSIKLGELELTLIGTGTDNYTCYKIAGSGTCTKGDSPLGDSAFDFRDFAEEVDGSNATYKKVGDQRIDDRDSSCWEVTDTSIASTVVTCIGKNDKVVTLVDGGTGFRMAITDYSSNVQDSAFEPPYPVT